MIVYTSLSSTKIYAFFYTTSLQNYIILHCQLPLIVSVFSSYFAFFWSQYSQAHRNKRVEQKSTTEPCNLQFFQADLPTCDTCVSSADLSGKQHEKLFIRRWLLCQQTTVHPDQTVWPYRRQKKQ